MPPLSFLDIPRELRDFIYEDYLTIDGGYYFNFKTGKLEPAKPGQQPLNLALTCSLIATEIKGLALTHNVITFSTTAGVRRHDAKRYASMMFSVNSTATAALWRLRKAITSDMRQDVAAQFPMFSPTLDKLVVMEEDDYDNDYWTYGIQKMSGLIPSLYYEALHYIVQLLRRQCMDPKISGLDIGCKPWGIPSEAQLDYMADALCSTLKDECCASLPIVWYDEIVPPWNGWEYYHLNPGDRSRYNYSAAAAAFFFLKSKPELLVHMRKLVLDEDRPSSLKPTLQGKGLIPFCEENPHLRIERRVRLWTNVLVSDDRPCAPAQRLEYALEGNPPWDAGSPAHYIAPAVWEWIEESLALPPNFSMVFDGNPLPELSAEIFRDVIVRDAVMQVAQQECIVRGLTPSPSWVEEPQRPPFNGYPQAIQDIANGSSNITCNFETCGFGELEVEETILKCSDFSYTQWDNERYNRPKTHYASAPPLPDWLELLKQLDIADESEE
ncbi:hypothetical protein SUNI508_06249 [Seiridium unicorne]|uniref:Uncharacterized protein n=1 Tax=Seiridium unicorne TaxID=138068 RepID=A0ABR2V1P1_9PEZI